MYWLGRLDRLIWRQTRSTVVSRYTEWPASYANMQMRRKSTYDRCSSFKLTQLQAGKLVVRTIHDKSFKVQAYLTANRYIKLTGLRRKSLSTSSQEFPSRLSVIGKSKSVYWLTRVDWPGAETDWSSYRLLNETILPSIHITRISIINVISDVIVQMITIPSLI